MASDGDSKPSEEDYKQDFETLAKGFHTLASQYNLLALRHESLQMEHILKLKGEDVKIYDHETEKKTSRDLNNLLRRTSPSDWYRMIQFNQSAPADGDVVSTLCKAQDLVRGNRHSIAEYGCEPALQFKPATTNLLGSLFDSFRKISGEHEASESDNFSLIQEKGSLSDDIPEIEDRPAAMDATRDCNSRCASKDGASGGQGGSCAGSASPCARCPIRYLNQKNPEEIANFFEEHKHELPRSHEICVKRFQDNAEGIRSLDAKYGDLVNMIHGLGLKHQPLLPEDPVENKDQEPHGGGGSTAAHIYKWAYTLGAAKLQPNEVEKGGERIPHFDRPVKDIRVGESPSRPWGEPIPPKNFTLSDPGVQDTSGATDFTALSKPRKIETEPKAGKCPFQHMKSANQDEETAKLSEMDGKTSSSKEKHVQFDDDGLPAVEKSPTKSEPFPSIEKNSTRNDSTECVDPSLTPHLNESTSNFQIYNHGTTVVKSLHKFSTSNGTRGMQLFNNGTLIVGYDELDLPKLMKNLN